MNIEIKNSNYTTQEKLQILADAAKYDVACTSSGSSRRGKKGELGNTEACGICHSFAADGRCISLLKILFTNQCIYDCKYCVNRCSNDTLRTAFTPDEVCYAYYWKFYRRNYIEGLFLSSGILSTADHTMELIYETLYKLRNVYHFNGYIHVKSIPGASGELVERLGFLADRMSINLELLQLPDCGNWRQERPEKRFCPLCARCSRELHCLDVCWGMTEDTESYIHPNAQDLQEVHPLYDRN